MTWDNRLFSIWKWVVLASPLWWLLGFNLFIYHAVSFFLFAILIYGSSRGGESIILPPSFFFLFFLVLIYSFSLLIHVPDNPISRATASAYNLSFWIMGICVIVLFSNIFSLDKASGFLRVFWWLAWYFGVLGALMFLFAFQGFHTISFPTPLYGLTNLLGNTTLVEQSTSVILLVSDWFAAFSRPRFNALSPYPTATAGIIMIVLFFLITSAECEKKKKSIPFLFLFTLNFLVFLMTLSRTSMMAFAVTFILVFIVQKKYPIFWLIAFLILSLFISPWFEKGIDFILGLRAGSTNARMELYRMSLAQLEGADWVIGLGLKPRIEDSVIPMGSHSTYVSLIFRTGILGFLTFLCFQANILWQWFRLKERVLGDRQNFFLWIGLGSALIVMSLWIFTEDLDAPQLLAFLYFSVVGVFEGFRRECLAKWKISITKI